MQVCPTVICYFRQITSPIPSEFDYHFHDILYFVFARIYWAVLWSRHVMFSMILSRTLCKVPSLKACCFVRVHSWLLVRSIERKPDLWERSECPWRLLSLENRRMCSTQEMYVVVQIYPWFYSLSHMATDTQRQRKIEFKPRIKLNQNINTQEGKHFYFNFLK